jgi:transposase
MIGCRKSTSMKYEVFKLKDSGHSLRKIALILGISRNTVKGILKNRKTNDQLEITVPSARAWSETIPWEEVKNELSKRYVTVKQLALEYSPEGIHYLRFWRELNRRLPKDLAQQVRIRMKHEPGDRFEVDYTDGLFITNRKTGKIEKTQLFAAVSSSSDYTFAEFTMKQTKCEFIASQNRMFHFFGGVPKYLVVDNLKSGVFKAHRYDPDLNPTYCDYANHMGFAVLPARPFTPRDKPAIEGAIGVIQRQFYAEVRNQIFYSLAEMNFALQKYIKKLNTDQMKDHGCSRAERYELEKKLFRPIPSEVYEITEHRNSKVHPDCHIQIERCFYSVPYKMIGQRVMVKLGIRTVEVFNEDHEPIAIHARKHGIGLFSTNESHYPEQKVAAARFDILSLKRDATKIGIETQSVIDNLLSGHSPLRYLRRAQGIVRLSKTLPAPAIEYGCKQASLFGRLRLKYITDCATQFQKNGARPVLVKTAPERDRSQLFLHEQN